MKYLLIDQSPNMISAWQLFFEDTPGIEIYQLDITQVRCDAIVSPANSFGFMDGGLDYALSMRFGWTLQEYLQNAIKNLPEGELLVGKALVIETDDPVVPFLISAPTMRVPMSFNIDVSINPYLAMKALLIAAKSNPAIETVAIPGLCTGSGGMNPQTAAQQMYMAFREIEYGEKLDFQNFTEAQKYHLALNPDGKLSKFD